MMRCNKCGEFFNPGLLSEVAEHMHNGIKLDKEYYGKEIKRRNQMNSKPRGPDITLEQAEAAGLTIDRSCYPNVAYKGPRFDPEEWYCVETEKESRLRKEIEKLKERL